MRAMSLSKVGLVAAYAAALAVSPGTVLGQASPYRGLWVGSAALSAVNEVSVPIDESGVPIAPNPEVPTPTFDRADLRLLIHVNGAGQAFLLKDVAILNRVHGQSTTGAVGFAEDKDLSLVTDPRIYASFPPQPATRIASAVVDFGDPYATKALDEIVESAANGAADFVATNASLDVSTEAARAQARSSAVAALQPSLDVIAENADVAGAFDQFLLLFDTAALTAIIADTSNTVVATLTNAAAATRDRSFYGDTRAVDMVAAVVAAVNGAPAAGRAKAAHHTASSYADVQNLYQRFISGGAFGDMMDASAEAAGTAAKQPGATAASIGSAMLGEPETAAALTAALQARVQMYDDARSTDAVNAVLAAMAADALAKSAQTEGEISASAAKAGRSALANLVARYPLHVKTPTLDYNAFIGSSALSGAPAAAASAAAGAAIGERAANPLYTRASLYSAAKVAAVSALRSAYGVAARVMRTELPLAGTFAPGSGDPRPISSLAQPSDLGPAGLTGRIYLPASHPTNPFRHRRHPDHTTGYNIERVVRLDFDGVSGDSLEPAGYGVDRITGAYREEIFGLHKPLGPDPVANPIGLRTEGRFELNRISLIDTLNTL
jgi:hypothetical protein